MTLFPTEIPGGPFGVSRPRAIHPDREANGRRPQTPPTPDATADERPPSGGEEPADADDHGGPPADTAPPLGGQLDLRG